MSGDEVTFTIEDNSFERSSGNVFEDLGLSNPDERLAKSDLILEIIENAPSFNYGNLKNFSIDRLKEMLDITQENNAKDAAFIDAENAIMHAKYRMKCAMELIDEALKNIKKYYPRLKLPRESTEVKFNKILRNLTQESE